MAPDPRLARSSLSLCVDGCDAFFPSLSSPNALVPSLFVRSGLDNAGKTTILKRLLGEDPSEVSPTLGFSIVTLTRGGHRLHVWDVGGQRSLRPYWRNYFEKTDGIAWVVDSADLDRMSDTREELARLLGAERLRGAGLLVLANKQDVPGAASGAEIEAHLQLKDLKNRAVKLVPCSAVSGTGVDQGFDWLVAEIAQRLYPSEKV